MVTGADSWRIRMYTDRRDRDEFSPQTTAKKKPSSTQGIRGHAAREIF